MNVAQEHNVSDAFSRQASVFDEVDRLNPIIQRMREQVHTHLLALLKPGDKILELNAGTGIDAIFLAQQGFDILATDNADGMLKELELKINFFDLNKKMRARKCSFNSLENIPEKFDHIFSNFGGLNCSENIENVIKQFDRLLNPNGVVTLVMMPPICPWELLFALKGNFKLAFRRLKKKGVRSHLEGVYFDTYYYKPKHLQKAFDKKKYSKISLKGLGILSPPPYLNLFPVDHPKLFKRLCRLEEKIYQYRPFNSWADHFIFTMKKH